MKIEDMTVSTRMISLVRMPMLERSSVNVAVREGTTLVEIEVADRRIAVIVVAAALMLAPVEAMFVFVTHRWLGIGDCS